ISRRSSSTARTTRAMTCPNRSVSVRRGRVWSGSPDRRVGQAGRVRLEGQRSIVDGYLYDGISRDVALQCADAATSLTAALAIEQRVVARFFRLAEFGVRSECDESVQPSGASPEARRAAPG